MNIDDPVELERAFLGIEDALRGYWSSETFRLDHLALERSYPWTRLVIYFRRDAHPELLYAFWAPIWEMIAWDQLHNAPIEPREAVPMLILELDDELFGAAPEGDSKPETEMGDRWIRKKVVW